MNRIRSKLILAFLAATIVPLIATLWIMTSLLERSLSFATTEQLDRLSKSLEETGRQYYQQARESLREDAQAGLVKPRTFLDKTRAEWPPAVQEFYDSGETERFALSDGGGNRLDYLLRLDDGAQVYSRSLGELRMEEITAQYREARKLVEQTRERDLRRGFTTTLIVLVASVWLVTLAWLIYLANRMSRPIQQLTAGLLELSSGRLETRIDVHRSDEIGRAINAFNTTAAELQSSRDRLVYLTQVASWQALARKMAHELKNSLTPIRLTIEEIRARQTASDPQFMDKAVRIVVSEIETLERRVRAFSDFSSDPAVRIAVLDVNTLIAERTAFLKSGHSETVYTLELAPNLKSASGDADRVKAILTNVLENAAEAAGRGGQILVRSASTDGKIDIEIHDSGPGLSAEARRTLFEPTITFKEKGMGLGLSIARKDALVCGGDLILIDGHLGGAGFRLILPVWGHTRAFESGEMA